MFRIEYVACAGDVYDVVEILCFHHLVCGNTVVCLSALCSDFGQSVMLYFDY